MKVFKRIKDLTREDIMTICRSCKTCDNCVLRKACCLTADLYSMLQKYKVSGDLDYELERGVCVCQK